MENTYGKDILGAYIRPYTRYDYGSPSANLSSWNFSFVQKLFPVFERMHLSSFCNANYLIVDLLCQNQLLLIHLYITDGLKMVIIIQLHRYWL